MTILKKIAAKNITPAYIAMNSFFIVMSVVLAPFIYNSSATLVMLAYMNFAIGIFSLYLWLLQRYVEDMNYGLVRKLFVAWVLIVLVGIVKGYISEGVGIITYISRTLQYDFKYLLFVASAFIYVPTENRKYVPRIMFWASIVGILYGAISLSMSSFDSMSLTIRSNTWTQQYYFWWGLGLGPFMYYYGKYNENSKYKIVGLCYLTLYVILGLLSTKRIALLNAVLWIAIPLFIPHQKKRLVKGRRNSKRLASIIIAIPVLIIIAYIFRSKIAELFQISQYTIDRFTILSEDQSAINRIDEYSWIFKNLSVTEILFGRGVGSFLTLDGTINGMHIGWMNLIYKSGLPMLLLYITIFIIPLFKRTNIINNNLECYYACSFWYAITLFIEGGWGHYPIIFPAMYSALILIDDRRIRKVNLRRV